jgi:membrane protein YqaA with SNARE-associated domain
MIYVLLSLFGVCFLSATLLPFPSEVAVAYAFKTYKSHSLLVLLIASCGNTLGGISNYYLAFLAAKKVKKREHPRAELILKRFGIWSSFFSFLPFVGDPLMALLGFYNAPSWKVFLLSFCGKFLRYLLVLNFFL